jgi:hypothetical protein
MFGYWIPEFQFKLDNYTYYSNGKKWPAKAVGTWVTMSLEVEDYSMTFTLT